MEKWSMCEWCTRHGDGKKWYLNIKNYSKELLNDEAAVEAANDFFQKAEFAAGMGGLKYPDLLKLRSDDEFSQVVAGTEKAVYNYAPHRGQVVPLEDANAIIKLAGPMAKIACICRRMISGSFEEKTCLLVGPVFLEYAKEWPDCNRGGMDYISKDEAVELIERFNEKGYVNTFWMDMRTPAILGLCNCSHPTCAALRSRRYMGDWYKFMFRKAEYVAIQDFDKCNGCGSCVQRCQFNAITFSPYWEKSIIDMKQCFGCGLCRNACEQDAIRLVSRSEVPAVRELW
jgi:NAD-dependent dihydropyrimidine dehydrogenase PreA subunit